MTKPSNIQVSIALIKGEIMKPGFTVRAPAGSIPRFSAMLKSYFAIVLVVLVTLGLSGCIGGPDEQYEGVKGEVMQIHERGANYIIDLYVMKFWGSYKNKAGNDSFELNDGQIITLNISKDDGFPLVFPGDYIKVDIERDHEEEYYHVKSLEKISHPFSICYVSIFILVLVVAILGYYGWQRYREGKFDDEDW